MLLFGETLSTAGLLNPLDEICSDMSWDLNSFTFAGISNVDSDLKQPSLLCDEDLEIPQTNNNRAITQVYTEQMWTPFETDVFLCSSIEQALQDPAPASFNASAQEQLTPLSLLKVVNNTEPTVLPNITQDTECAGPQPCGATSLDTVRAMPDRAAKSRTRATAQRGKASSKRKAPTRKVPDDSKDEDYLERRRRNNLAAKRSRQAHRQREIEQINRLKSLQRENSDLKKRADKLILRNSKLQTKLLQLG